MQPLQQFYIAGSKSGYINYQKPFLTPNDAFQVLENALVYRDRVIERPGLTLLGRLRRGFTATAAGNVTAAPGVNTYNVKTGLGVTETNAEIAPGTSSTIVFSINGQTLTDSTGNGTLVVAPAGDITSASINYSTWVLKFTSTAGFGPSPLTATLMYYPGLPCMGIWQAETSNVNNETTVFFDTKYAYVNLSGAVDGFNEWIPTSPATTWDGDDADFFLGTNYRGVTEFNRLFFVTNFNNTTGSPMRYTDGVTWTPFAPGISGATPTSADNTYMFQARILIPYYGRLVALNTYEGTTVGGAQNYYNRCRFSRIGNPVEETVLAPTFVGGAWRSDVYGKGGFIDAPTAESIVSALFFKNTLIVGFERSTWQLRYVGEYGFPFVWERISSDFGCESTFSPVLFDQGVLQVGDRAIVSATSNTVNRIDEQIPDVVFSFKNDEFGKGRVWGIRDFQNELVYWNYVNPGLERSTYKFPNSSLVYNYRNNTYAVWRNNITAFGVYQSPLGIKWSSLTTFWSDRNIFWKNTDNPEFPAIVGGNQQGYISYFTTTLYDQNSIDEPTLSIHAVDFSVVPAQLTVPNHNLATGDWIRITSALFNVSDPGLNGYIYNVIFIDNDTIALRQWNIVSQSFVDMDFTSSAAVYQGLGQIAFYPLLSIVSKDFNPYQEQAMQMKLSYIDFLVDSQPSGQFAVNLYINTNLGNSANIITGNKKVEEWYQLFGLIVDITIDTTNTNPCVIKSLNHGLRTGQQVYIDDVTGTTQLNNNTYIVTYIDANNFSIAVDQSGFSPYLGGGRLALH